MWGNKLGWTISALIVIATVAFVVWLDRSARTVSPRTAFSRDSDNGAAIALPVSPKIVLPAMTDPRDAGEIYRRARQECLRDFFTYSQFARSGLARDIENVPAINILIEATNYSSADLFRSHPAEIVNVINDKPPLEALRILGACARRAGQLIEKQKPAEAMKLYEATFSLGAKMYQERLTFAQLDAGLTMMAEATTMIGLLANTTGDAARAQAVKQFDEARRPYVKDRLLPVQTILSSVDQPTLEKHAGDVLFFARYGEERMWRVEAIFALGRYRYNAGRSADQRTANRVIQELCNDPDPIIQTVSAAARDLTIEQYRMLR